MKGLGRLILKTRWVDIEEKFPFCGKGFATYITTEFFSAASTPTTHLLVDSYAVRFDL